VRCNDPRGITVQVEHSQQFDEVDEEAQDAENGIEKAAAQDENGDSMLNPSHSLLQNLQRLLKMF
jgi:hypothetical protein